MSKKKKPEKPVDEIREAILRMFYDTHKNASSPKKVRLKINDAKRALKELGITGKEAVSNIEYLVDGGWIIKEVDKKEFTTKTGVTVPSETAHYKASNKTIDHFDRRESIFKVTDVGGINISNVGGVTAVTVGDSNTVVVNEGSVELHKLLDELKEAVTHTEKISDEEKLNHKSDIETIQAQLQKPEPSKGIIKGAWDGIKKAAGNTGKVVELYNKVEPLIAGFLG